MAGEIIAIGRIVVQQIFDFLKANPKLTIGLAIGAAIGMGQHLGALALAVVTVGVLTGGELLESSVRRLTQGIYEKEGN